MKFFGNLLLQQNELQQAALESETDFPAQPVVGRLLFKDKVVYICVEIASGVPVWVPLTRELNTYIHNQTEASDTWNINHGLKSGTVTVQVYDNNSYMIIPGEVSVIDRDNVRISLGLSATGRAIVMCGDLSGSPKASYAFEYYKDVPATTWTIAHGLGYNPIVRVFVGNQEIQPSSITFNNTSVVTVEFATALAGVAKLI